MDLLGLLVSQVLRAVREALVHKEILEHQDQLDLE